MSAQHTADPLFVKAAAAPCSHNGDIGIVNGKGSLIAVALARPEALANARLFAAAHKLLEAAQRFVTHLERVGIPNDDQPYVNALIVAIAEAAGEAA